MAINLTAKTRTTNTKGIKKRLRREGHIPAIVYGRGFENVLLSVPYKEFTRLLKKGGETSVIELVINDQQHNAVVKEIQSDVVTGSIIHIDFQKVYSDQPINKEVPIRLIGDEVAKKLGVIQFQKREIEVRGLPHEIPSQIDVDITPLSAGAVVSVGEVPIPTGLEVFTSKDEVVLSLVSGSYIEEEAEEETGFAEGEIM